MIGQSRGKGTQSMMTDLLEPQCCTREILPFRKSSWQYRALNTAGRSGQPADLQGTEIKRIPRSNNFLPLKIHDTSFTIRKK